MKSPCGPLSGIWRDTSMHNFLLHCHKITCLLRKTLEDPQEIKPEYARLWMRLNVYPSFVLQLISLAGIHSTATITNELSKRFAEDGMLAYVDLVQSREKENGCDVLTHQKWSGAEYMDGILGAIQSGSSGSKSMGEGNTEKGM